MNGEGGDDGQGAAKGGDELDAEHAAEGALEHHAEGDDAHHGEAVEAEHPPRMRVAAGLEDGVGADTV